MRYNSYEMKKELPKRVFKKGKKPLGKTSVKIREKRVVVQRIEQDSQAHFKFPNINLSIPEMKLKVPHMPSSWIQFVWIGLVVFSVGLLLWQVSVFAQVYPASSQLALKRKSLQDQLTTWQNLSTQYPLYRDAHMEIALLAYRLGERAVMRVELDKVLTIDPNFSEGRTLQKYE